MLFTLGFVRRPMEGKFTVSLSGGDVELCGEISPHSVDRVVDGLAARLPIGGYSHMGANFFLGVTADQMAKKLTANEIRDIFMDVVDCEYQTAED